MAKRAMRAVKTESAAGDFPVKRDNESVRATIRKTERFAGGCSIDISNNGTRRLFVRIFSQYDAKVKKYIVIKIQTMGKYTHSDQV